MWCAVGVTAHTERMSSDRAVIPAWIEVAHRAVRDAHRIAYRIAVEGDMRAGGIASAINWVTGGEAAPLSQRTGMTRDLAWAEWLLAGSVEHATPMVFTAGEGPPPVAVVTDQRWASGAGAALGWLLGATPPTRTPVPVPVRLEDGRVPTADDLYQRMRDTRPHAAWTPEQRARARQQAVVTAARNRRLADLAG